MKNRRLRKSERRLNLAQDSGFSLTSDVHLVSSTDSAELTHLTRALSRSTLIGLDAEWKPIRCQQSTFPTVTLLQLACQLGDDPAEWDESVVFLLDLASIPLPSIWDLLKDVEPYLDITNIYKFLQHKQGKKVSKDANSLSAICEEVLDIPLSKAVHPTFFPFQMEFSVFATTIMCSHTLLLSFVGTKFCNALHIVQATASSEDCERIAKGVEVIRKTKPMDESLWNIVRKYGEKLLLRESDRIPKTSKKKGKRQSSVIVVCREKQLENSDAAIPHSKKPEPRELIDQAYKEKRVLLTRDAKLLRHQCLIKNQIFRVNSLLENEQLLEVIENFQLKISEDQLMSRCTKCNGRFIQKPLTTEETIETFPKDSKLLV
ncbi:hypothetical protein CRYUN_Cryun12cG0077500 [Craigia yunnanensis]